MIDSLSEVIDSNNSGAFEVRGPAGSGKTFTLIEAYKHLKNTGKIGRVISFSNAAVGELNNRLNVKPNGFIQTIHSFAWSWLKIVLNDVRKSDSFDFVPQAISKEKGAKTEFRDFSWQYGQFGTANIQKSKRIIWLSHDDVLDAFMSVAHSFSAFAELIGTTSDFIFIDEYQDSNKQIAEFLRDVVSEYTLVIFFGDPLQNVYDELNGVGDINLSPGQIIKLPTNYRSDKNLLPLFNALRKNFDGVVQQPAEKVTDQGKLKVALRDGELGHTSFGIPDDYYVLALTHNLRSKAVSDAEIVPLKKMVENALNRKRIDWAELMDTEKWPGELKVIFFLASWIKGNKFSDIQNGLTIFDIMNESELGAALQARENFDSLTGLDELLANLPLLSEIDKETIKNMLQDNKDNLGKFYKLYQDIPSINMKSQTISGSKGLEFDNVILEVDSGKWKQRMWNETDFDRDESLYSTMHFLFYVGATRARQNLIIYVNTSDTGDFGKNLIEFLENQNVFFDLV